MDKKRIFIVLLMLGFSVSLMGCEGENKSSTDKAVVDQINGNDKDGKTTVDKIVIEEDVTKKVGDGTKVTVEEVELNIDEGEYFQPGFYLDGKLYGAISKGYGHASDEPTEDFPIDGQRKKYLYALNDENVLEETNKEIFKEIHGIKSADYKYEQGSTKEILITDFGVDDAIRKAYGLEKAMNKNIYDKPNTIREVLGSEEYYYFNSNNAIGDKESYLAIYDEKNNEIYEMKIAKGERVSILYIKETNSLMAWDINNGLIHKVTLKDGHITLEKYINIEEMFGEKVGYIDVINESEIIIGCTSDINKTDIDDKNPIYRTDKISKYNFKTNEYKVLFEGSKGKNMLIHYSGNNIFTADEFEEAAGKMSCKNRYIMRVKDEELRVIFKEDIQGEGENEYGMNQGGSAVVNEEGNEIFFVKHLCDINGKSKKAIYKRYVIENK
ncbi:MAG: hypothetical protein RSA29_11835 [Clostridium sp.]|uniref:hypothetical protein n=1 Tax=Clostridium sp. TaxID=1506 RepID=UPI00302D921E